LDSKVDTIDGKISDTLNLWFGASLNRITLYRY